jgi:hypothetical protein
MKSCKYALSPAEPMSSDHFALEYPMTLSPENAH